MNILPSQRRKSLLHKKPAFLIALLGGGIIAVWLAVKIVVPLLWPEDHYLVQEVPNTPETVPYAHTYQPLDIEDEQQLSVLGYSPIPSYLPEGYALESAVLITNENSPGNADARAIRLEYVCSGDSERRFFVMASAGPTLLVKTEKDVFNQPSAYSNYGESRWATFAETDVIIYKIRTARQYFSRFSPNEHEWLVCFTKMNMREVRLVITAILTQFQSNTPERNLFYE